MKPLILITNDDGCRSPGLQAVAEAVRGLGEILVAAPFVQQTGMGRAFPRAADNGIIEQSEMTVQGDRIPVYGVHGSPALAVAHGILEIAGRKPDLCISGINYGENLGMTVTCSGTLGAAFEAVSHGVPAIAVSVAADLSVQRTEAFPRIDWGPAMRILRSVAGEVLEKGMWPGADLLNINLPKAGADGSTYRVTSLSRQNYFCFRKPGKRDWSKPFSLQSELAVNLDGLEPDSDIYAVYVDRQISVTPLSVRMTAECLDSPGPDVLRFLT